MVNLPFDIDTIVRQVIADLGGKGGVWSVECGVKDNSKLQTPNSKLDKATLRLPDLLVTLALLEGRLDGVREVVISPKAVVTPSVRDLLYKKEIRVQSSECEDRMLSGRTDIPGSKAAGDNSTLHTPHSTLDKPTEVWLALHQMKREPEMLLGFLQGQTSFSKESFNCIVATTQAAAKRLAESEAVRAIIVTNHSAAAMVLANRHAAIRAIVGENTDQTAQDAAMTGANLLVLHADRLGAWRMKELARVFLANRSTQCPKIFRAENAE